MDVVRGISARMGELVALKDARQLWLLPNYVGWKPRLYDRFFGTLLGAVLRTREEAIIYGLLGDVLKLSHSVLEVGCGTGNLTVPLAHRCARMVAVDASPEMLRYTRGRLDREGLRSVETRLERLPDRLGSTRSFDGTLAVGVLNYVQDLEGALRSACLGAAAPCPTRTPLGEAWPLALLFVVGPVPALWGPYRREACPGVSPNEVSLRLLGVASV